MKDFTCKWTAHLAICMYFLGQGAPKKPRDPQQSQSSLVPRASPPSTSFSLKCIPLLLFHYFPMICDATLQQWAGVCKQIKDCYFFSSLPLVFLFLPWVRRLHHKYSFLKFRPQDSLFSAFIATGTACVFLNFFNFLRL